MKIIIIIANFLILGISALNSSTIEISNTNIPLVVITWDYTDATKKAWEVINDQGRSALDAVEVSCALCEEQQCRKTVGFGGSPDENGETTLDALIMDGVTMDVGGVGGLRYVKNAIGVARKVLENTRHSLLGGSLATDFAVKMGFAKESLETDESTNMWLKWKNSNCQPNYWKNVVPDPRNTCGPYHPLRREEHVADNIEYSINEDNHDTIGVVAIDKDGKIAAGTSTNGAKYKIPGRIGDSPIAGAGAYADQQVGAAAGTGDGDIMMRFLPSFLAVEEMRRGASPNAAAETAIRRIAERYPNFVGGVIALNKQGEYGAACNGLPRFPHYVVNRELGKPTQLYTPCIQHTPSYCVLNSGNC